MDLSVFLSVFSIFEASSRNGTLNKNFSTKAPFWIDQNINKSQENSTDYCRGAFGCFPTTDPWKSSERPVSLSPGLLKDINPFYCLHSAANPSCMVISLLNETDIHIDKDLNISSSSYLIVITHGFLNSVEMPWVKQMVNALLSKYDDQLRIVTLDWRKGSQPPYAQAAANIRLLGAATGRLLQILIENYNLNPAKIHLIGHSLGAHLFGHSGYYIKAKMDLLVGRITGMDPAGPYFRGTPTQIRLDFTDAYLVDIIHTDSTQLIPSLPMSLGLPESSGHFDFFPNGGMEQNGCSKSAQEHIMEEKDVSMGVLEYVSCNHEKSHRYFTSSIHKNCEFIGIECHSWKEFKEGKCWDCNQRRCFKMGFGIGRVFPEGKISHQSVDTIIANQETEIKLFLATTTNEDVCGNQVRFTLVPSDSSDALKAGGDFVKFSLVLRGNYKAVKFTPFKKAQHVKPGVNITWVEAIPELGQIYSIVFILEEDEGFLKKLLWPMASHSALHLKQIVVDTLLHKQSMTFPFCNELVTSNQNTILESGNCK